MGKREQRQAEQMAKDNTQRAQGAEDEMRGFMKGELGGATETARDTYGAARSGYGDYMGGTGAYDPASYNVVSKQNQQNIGTGGYDPGRVSSIRSDIDRNVQTGGYTGDEYSQLTGGGLGGVNAEQAGVVRDAYGNLIKTGGLSDEAAGAMRRQAAGTTQSIYSTLGSKLARSQSIAGMGGAGGETAQMARQAAQAGAVATTGANAEIGKLRQAGTIAGVGGLAQFEQGVGAGNRAALSDVAGNRLRSTDQSINLETNRARNVLDASKSEQDLVTNAAQQRIQAAGGLVNLYNSSPGYVNDLVKGIMQQQSVTGQLTTQQAQIMQELSKNPGLFQTIMNSVTQLGGAAAGVMTGIGGLPKAGKK
jgi:hypothetical protein